MIPNDPIGDSLVRDLSANKIHRRIDLPNEHFAPEQETVMWSLNEELMREMSTRLSVLSSCLGTCQQLTRAEKYGLNAAQLQQVIAIANEELSLAGELVRSARCLSSVQQAMGTPQSINHSIDDALAVLHPRLRKYQITVEMQRHETARVVHDSSNLAKTLIALIGSMIPALAQQPHHPRTLSIDTNVCRPQIEILVANIHPESTLPVDSPRQGLPGNRMGPEGLAPGTISEQTGTRMARMAAAQLGCHVRFGKTRSGDQAYSILFEAEQSLPNAEGQMQWKSQ